MMRTLGTGPCCTNNDFNNTTNHICTATITPIPPVMKGFTVRGWERVFGCVCLLPSLGSVPNPCGLGYLIDSELEGYVATYTFYSFFTSFSVVFIQSPSLGIIQL